MNTYIAHTFAGVQVIQADRMEVKDGLIAFLIDAPENDNHEVAGHVVKVLAVHYVKEIEERPDMNKPVITAGEKEKLGDILNG